MNRLAFTLFAPLLLAACGTPTGPLAPSHAADFTICRTEADRAPRVDSLGQRVRYIDECMHKRGWKPTSACVYTDQVGTSFCEYRR
jgi:hypothetical protein